MGNKRRCTGLDWIFSPMGMGKKRCALFNPMVMGKRRRRCGIYNPILRSQKRCGDGDGDGKCNGDDLLLLPEDVLIKVLVCLPVKSLLLFKSVCKSWRQLIESSFFIDLHTTFNSSSKFGAFIIQTSEPSNKDEDNIKLFKLSSSDGDGPDDGDGTTGGEDDDDDGEDDDQKKKKKIVVKVDDLGFLPFYKDYLLHDTLRMVGSCNGIICLHDTGVMEDYSRQDYSSLRDVCLWNPATRQFRILPKSIFNEEKLYIISMGNWLDDFIAFGFDVKTKDYKVLRITGWMEGEECKCQVQVYSLSTDSWRLLEGINSLPGQVAYMNHGIYLNGSYYFVGRKHYPEVVRDDFMLLSFDFTKEIFNTIQLPENYSRYNRMVVSSLGGKMALFDGGYKYYDIWVLNNEQHGSDLGVLNKESSWTKLHSNLLFRMKNSRKKGNPRCISNNGEFALMSKIWGNNNNKLQWFNLVTKEAKKDFTIGRRGTKVHRADVYKESLVSIMGGGNVLLRWQLPTHGTTYKLNLDAPFIDSYYPFGIGLCLTSDAGGCIGVRSFKSKRYVRDAKEGEAMAMLEAIKWAKELKLAPIIIESDSKDVVSFFMDDDDDNSTYWSSEALSLLREAKLLLNSSELGISLKYCYRSCNYVADIAAKLGRERLTWTCMDWTAKFPGEMVRSLSKKDFASKTW